MTPREKLIESMQSIIDGTAILTVDMDSGKPLLLNPDKIAEAIIDYLKLEVVDNETKPRVFDLVYGLSKSGKDLQRITDLSQIKDFEWYNIALNEQNNAVINIDNL